MEQTEYTENSKEQQQCSIGSTQYCKTQHLFHSENTLDQNSALRTLLRCSLVLLRLTAPKDSLSLMMMIDMRIISKCKVIICSPIILYSQ
jgi:hypothetical protein